MTNRQWNWFSIGSAVVISACLVWIGFWIGVGTSPTRLPDVLTPAAAPIPPIPGQAAYRLPCNVLRCIDGDTAELSVRLPRGMRAIWKVRILGIDTPEMGTVEGSKAKIEAQAFAESKDGAMVFEQSIEDSFGRMLVDVEIAGERWSRHMLSTGNARPYDGR